MTYRIKLHRLISVSLMLLSFSTVFAQEPSTSSVLQPPLTTVGANLVDRTGSNVRLMSVNWYGGHFREEVPAGLEQQPISNIAELIKSKGFNSVRLTFSNQMLHDDRKVAYYYVSANPELANKTPLEVFDAVVKGLTDAHIAVVLNNHTTSSEWCCNYDPNGMWHNDYFGNFGYKQTTAQWISDWVMLAQRYAHNPYVIGMELRNEVRTAMWTSGIPNFPNWGNGDANDWHKAAQDAGNAILAVNPNALIFVEGINFRGIPGTASANRPFLAPIRDRNLPIKLIVPNRIVYVAHNYSYIGPRDAGGGPDFTRIPPDYKDMSPAEFDKTITQEWGYLAQPGPYQAPIWVSEFGASGCTDSATCSYYSDQATQAWLNNLSNYIVNHKLSWGWWPINPTRLDLGPFDEDPSGLVNHDWTAFRTDWRFQYIDRLLQAK